MKFREFSPKGYALFLLKRKDYSVAEMKEKMARKEFPQGEINQTIIFLRENKFLDDERYARNFVRNQLFIRPTGRYLLKEKLKQKKIDHELIDQVLLEYKESEEISLLKLTAERWLKKKADSVCGDSYKIKEKLIRHLISKGFNYELIKSSLDTLI